MAIVEIKIKGLNEFQKKVGLLNAVFLTEMRKSTALAAFKLVENCKEETPKVTTTLSSSIRAKFFMGGLGAKVSPHKNYAIFVHEGTRPHVIRPRTKKALYWKGAIHPVRKVNHPGTEANPFMTRGLEKSTKDITNIYNQGIRKVLNTLKN